MVDQESVLTEDGHLGFRQNLLSSSALIIQMITLHPQYHHILKHVNVGYNQMANKDSSSSFVKCFLMWSPTVLLADMLEHVNVEGGVEGDVGNQL